MTITKRQFSLSLSLLLLPTLAHADALDGLAWLLGLLVSLYVLAGLTLLVTILAYRLTERHWLRWASWLLTGVAVVLGMLWQRAFGSMSSALSTLMFNPFLFLCLPLALWLHGVRYVRQAGAGRSRAVGLAVAVLGLSALLAQCVSMLNRSLWSAGWGGSSVALAVFWLINIGCDMLAWWIVLRQVQKYEPLSWADWSQIATTAGIYAGVTLVFSLFSMWLTLSSYGDTLEVDWVSRLPWLLGSAVLNCAVAGLMLWWEQQRRTGQSPVR